MLPSQRALFDLPREVCYLNAAGWSPLPLAVQEAGRAGVARKVLRRILEGKAEKSTAQATGNSGQLLNWVNCCAAKMPGVPSGRGCDACRKQKKKVQSSPS